MKQNVKRLLTFIAVSGFAVGLLLGKVYDDYRKSKNCHQFECGTVLIDGDFDNLYKLEIEMKKLEAKMRVEERLLRAEEMRLKALKQAEEARSKALIFRCPH